MKEPSAEMNPQIQISTEEHEEWLKMDSPDSEIVDKCDAGDKETQAKVQSVFQQVRRQIRSQVAVKASKSSIIELVNRLKDKQSLEKSMCPAKGEQVTGESQAEADLRDEALCAVFEKKLEDTKKALRDEFEERLSQVRSEMQAYTEQSLKVLECKIQRASLKEQECKGQDKKQKPSTATLSKRGRALTRTMTTIIPKTSPSFIVGPRAKSETLTSSKVENSRIVLREPGVSSMGSNSYQIRKPLPPVWPPLHQCKKTVGPKRK